ncbi:glutathione S-transferase C-terminal-like protein [Lyophyllum atratum]|nr:glutathione S-transferase C-terminal-like protein [Lyophyllum atratum]
MREWSSPGRHLGGLRTVNWTVAALRDVTSLELPAEFKRYVDNKKPDFLRKSPYGKIPALEDADGFKVFEGVAIARYVASLAPNAGLFSKDLTEAGLIDQWIHLTESEVDQLTNLIGQLLPGAITPYSKLSVPRNANQFKNSTPAPQIHATVAERQRRALNTLNAQLATRTFFVGERITLADIYIATQIRRAATVTFDAPLHAELPHLIRHAETVVNQPKIKEFFKSVEYVQKVPGFSTPPPFPF